MRRNAASCWKSKSKVLSARKISLKWCLLIGLLAGLLKPCSGLRAGVECCAAHSFDRSFSSESVCKVLQS